MFEQCPNLTRLSLIDFFHACRTLDAYYGPTAMAYDDDDDDVWKSFFYIG